MVLMLFLRILEIVITNRKTGSGIVFYKWTFKALAVVHVIVGVFAILEYFFIKKQINYIVTFLGLSIFVAALILRNSAISELGEFHSIHIKIRDNHKLITSGIYSYLRHPYYIAVSLEVPSLALIPNSYYAFCFAILFYLPLVFFRIYKEDEALAGKFANEYLAYKNKVPICMPIKIMGR